MPIYLEWFDDEQTIIHQRFVKNWSWSEFQEINHRRVPEMMHSVGHTVHIISDFRHAYRMPVGGAISHISKAMKQYPDNWGNLVVVGSNRPVALLVEIFRRTFASSLGKRTFLTACIEEAQTLIRQYEAPAHD